MLYTAVSAIEGVVEAAADCGSPLISNPTIVEISETNAAVFLEALDTLTIMIADSTMFTTSRAKIIIDNIFRFIIEPLSSDF
jgi:hypothetical protein